MKTSHPMLVEPYCFNPMRIARVEQLRQLYLEREPQEISPFDYQSAKLEDFQNSYENPA